MLVSRSVARMSGGAVFSGEWQAGRQRMAARQRRRVGRAEPARAMRELMGETGELLRGPKKLMRERGELFFGMVSY